jgi:hypothetical protein
MRSHSLRGVAVAVILLAMGFIGPSGDIGAQPPPFTITATVYQDLDGDFDAYPDTGETGRVTVTLQYTGIGPLTGTTFTLISSDPDVACITEKSLCGGDWQTGNQKTIGTLNSIGFAFRASNTLNTVSILNPEVIDLCLIVDADQFTGPSDPICFSLTADIDSPTPASQNYIPNGGVLSEDFDTDRNFDQKFTILDTFQVYDAGTNLTYHGSYLNGSNMGAGGPCPGFLVPPNNPGCILDPDYPMDWHLHCPNGATTACPNVESGVCAGGCSFDTPANGIKAHSCPDQPNNRCNSLHMGAHFDGNNVAGDSTHFRTLQAFVSPPINLALFPQAGDLKMSLYQIVDLMDDNGVAPNNTGRCVDCAQVQIQVDQDPDPAVDVWGLWDLLVPFENVYDHTPNDPLTFGDYYCLFGPLDAASATQCYPQGAWSHCGDAHGGTTFDCPGPGSAGTGTGTWVRSSFDLAAYQGSRVRIRWVGSTWMFDSSSSSYYEVGPGWNTSQHDDGWWLDDISITGVIDKQLAQAPDPSPPPATTCPANNCVQAPANLVGWWPFDEPCGLFAEDLANSLRGRLLGTPPPSHVIGKVGNALKFSGSGPQWVRVPDDPLLDFGPANALGTTDFSIDAWIKAPPTTLGAIVDKRDTSPYRGYSLFVYNNRLGVQLADGNFTNYVATSGNVANGVWHHVAVTVDRDNPNGGILYRDGQPVLTFNPTNRNGSLANSNKLFIGKGAASGAEFKGIIDELEIFRRALTQAEIQSIFQADSYGKCK